MDDGPAHNLINIGIARGVAVYEHWTAKNQLIFDVELYKTLACNKTAEDMKTDLDTPNQLNLKDHTLDFRT